MSSRSRSSSLKKLEKLKQLLSLYSNVNDKVNDIKTQFFSSLTDDKVKY